MSTVSGIQVLPIPSMTDLTMHFPGRVPYLPPLRSMIMPAIESPVESPIEETPEKADLKERNRVAAQKWRMKKDQYLNDLEQQNDGLRRQALDLVNQANALRVQNRILEEELAFFQQFMQKMMSNPRH